MKVLVVGSGSREHSLLWKIRQSPLATSLYCAPGNAGTAGIAENVPLKADDVIGLARWTAANSIDLTIVGPEAPLVGGIVDEFRARDLPVFGPSKAAAQIEGSKAWAKELLLHHNIPTASGAVFTDSRQAKEYLLSSGAPVVVKADGLAAGKGVVVADTVDDALRAVDEIMVQRAFGSAGERVLIEERLEGLEVSVLALTDGEKVIPLPPACDYKRINDNDQGPNTGGMGAYSPPGFLSFVQLKEIERLVLRPTVRALAQRGIPYRGVLYAGLMLTTSGPKVLEFNCRFGDPETQVILPRIQDDVLPLFHQIAAGNLRQEDILVDEAFCCGIVLASGGYPGEYRTGQPISGLDADREALVFHAGTATNSAGQVVTSGGRVMTVVGRGRTVDAARAIAYESVDRISFEGRHFRRDIALREM